MNPRTRMWSVGSLLAWTALIHGWLAGDTWFIGLSLLLFLVLMVERWDNWARSRGAR